MISNIPKTGIVIFGRGALGGAEKRHTNLFIYLNNIYPGRFYFFVNKYLYSRIKDIYPRIDTANIRIVDYKSNMKIESDPANNNEKGLYRKPTPDLMEVDKKHTYPRKVYWYFKNKFKQRSLYRVIETYRQELGIEVFYGVYSGIFPLVFYFNETPPKAQVIFSDMDSWFLDITADTKKLWYRKYYSFNYALENADAVDFLSPYIYNGVKKLGVKIREDFVSIAPCSFTDYSICKTEKKKNFEIAFCARLEPQKNPLLYLESVKEVSKKYPSVKFHLLGEGPLYGVVKNFIDSNNLDNKINFRFYNNPPEIFKDTSIFISLQNNTNYPSQSVLEAMACGNSVIASSKGDTNLLVNKDNGILVNLDKDEIVNAITYLINNRELCIKMGENGKKIVMENHTVEKYADYFLNLIKGMVK